MLNQSQFAKQRGWSRQYVGRLVRDGVITLEPNGLIDPERADAQLAQNRGGTMRTAPIKSRRGDDAGEGVHLAWDGPPEHAWQAGIDVILKEFIYRCGACVFMSRIDDMTFSECSSILRDILEWGLAELDKIEARLG